MSVGVCVYFLVPAFFGGVWGALTASAVSPFHATSAFGPVQVNMTTSAESAYSSTSGVHRLRLELDLATFQTATDCADVLNALGGFPALSACTFTASEAIFELQTRFAASTEYALTVNVFMPSSATTSNTFDVYIEASEDSGTTWTVVESATGVFLTNFVYAAASSSPADTTNGYISGFKLVSQAAWAANSAIAFEFTVSSLGTMNTRFAIDVIAYPPDRWNLGTVDAECNDYSTQRLVPGSVCRLKAFDGSGGKANGFRISLISGTFEDLMDAPFKVSFNGPAVSLAMVWVAQSMRISPDSDIGLSPAVAVLDTPIYVMGAPKGGVVVWENEGVSAEQWVTLAIYPDNNIIPTRSGTGGGGAVVISPPENFAVVTSTQPETVAGANSLPCTSWTITSASWSCEISTAPIFKDTQYFVKLLVTNRPTPSAALAWTVIVQDATGPTPNYLAASRDFRGFPVYTQMTASLAHSNQILGETNSLTITVTPAESISRVVNSKIRVVAPVGLGFVFDKRCPGFEPLDNVSGSSTTCKGSGGESLELTFGEKNVIQAGVTLRFHVEVENPTAIATGAADAANVWYLYTINPDNTGVNVIGYPGFTLFPGSMASFAVSAANRQAGARDVLVKFKSGTGTYQTLQDDYIRIQAPAGVLMGSLARFSTASADTGGANSISAGSPSIPADSGGNVIEFQVLATLTEGFEYGVRLEVTVPGATPEVNSWWIEQYRLTGDVSNPYEYVASRGAAGFKTQVLENVQVVPYNYVREHPNNPITVTFRTTTAVKTSVAAVGEVRLTGPAGFYFICPVEQYTGSYVDVGDVSDMTSLPEATLCEALPSQSHILRLYFPSGGLEADTQYAFAVVNANPASVPASASVNVFTLATRLGSTVVEQATVAGFQLTTSLLETVYSPQSSREDRRAGVLTNELTFVLGLAIAMPTGSVLELIAPEGFSLARDELGTCIIEGANYLTGYATFPQSTSLSCLSPAGTPRVAQVTVNSVVNVAKYALRVVVSNPYSTPSFNTWQINIWSNDGSGSLTKTQSESMIQGFTIQEILEPRIYPFNAGNAIVGESAPNPVDIMFTTVTQVPVLSSDARGGFIEVTAPEGFYFPPVCRYFSTEVDLTMTGLAAGSSTGSLTLAALPEATTCAGGAGGHSVLLTLPRATWLTPGTYGFRVLVENPAVTTSEAVGSTIWGVRTAGSDQTTIDSNSTAIGFPVRQRLRYFAVAALSSVGGAKTALKLSFSLYGNLPAQGTIEVLIPTEIDLAGLVGRACVNPDTVDGEEPDGWSQQAVSLAFLQAFGQSALAGVAQLPSYIECEVVAANLIRLTNTESVRRGRPLLAGPVYEQIVTNVVNPYSTPSLNLWRIQAYTVGSGRPETWASQGYSILSELNAASVTSSNPGYGLFTTFEFNVNGVTDIPDGGSIRIEAPTSSFYFGPRLEDPDVVVDPLSTVPPAAGQSMPRPVTTSNACSVTAPVLTGAYMECPFTFDVCVQASELETLAAAGLTVDTASLALLQQKCEAFQTSCLAGNFHEAAVSLGLDAILACVGYPGALEVTLGAGTKLVANTDFAFAVTGYNADFLASTAGGAGGSSSTTWRFFTRDSDSSKTVLDRKYREAALKLLGVLYVDLIQPSETRVSISDNLVEVHIRLSTAVVQPARMNVYFPVAFQPDSSANIQVVTSGGFPPRLESRVNGNQVQIDSKTDALPRDSTLILSLTLSNPQISPADADNIWGFETMSLAAASLYTKADVNYDVAGFRVFGALKNAMAAPRVKCPTVSTNLGIWMSLESDLPWDSTNPTSFIVINLPPGFTPIDDACGGVDMFNTEYTYYSDAEVSLPTDRQYVPIPSGSICESLYDEELGRTVVSIQVDESLDYGIDYAFQIGVKNAAATEDVGSNFFEFQTKLNGVVLHLLRDVEAYAMRSLKTAVITPENPSAEAAANVLNVTLQSVKYIPGSSLITVRAPVGFVFSCAFVSYAGLAPTTSCNAAANVALFTMDVEDDLQPGHELSIFVRVKNPPFTPQPNTWRVDVETNQRNSIDVEVALQGFDITGTVQAELTPQFTYKNHRNLVSIKFLPSTIMNRADLGNELRLDAPEGFVFPSVCSSFTLAPLESGITGFPIPDDYVFPPPGTTCQGFDNSTLVVRFPAGSGLQRYWYKLTIIVINAPTTTSGDSAWIFRSQVNPTGDSANLKVVDINTQVAGFAVTDLVITDKAFAPGSSLALALLAALLVLATTLLN